MTSGASGGRGPMGRALVGSSNIEVAICDLKKGYFFFR